MSFYPLATSSWDEQEQIAIRRVIEKNQFSMGQEVRNFEKDFADYFSSRFAVMVNSGSSANLLAVAATVFAKPNALKSADEVIVPAVSWSTTYFPLQQYGFKLRFVDVNEKTLGLDVNFLEDAITPKTRAVVAVNLLGNPLDLRKVKDICDRHNLVLIEDNAESMGARFDGRFAGTYGLAGTFSCFFSHHISTMEGGVIVTDDEHFYHTLLSLRAHGWVREQPANSQYSLDDMDDFSKLFRFILPGYNVRPLEMSGAIGIEQLKKLPKLVQGRRKNALLYQELFGDHDGVDIQHETGESSWFGFAFILKGPLTRRRSEVVAKLAENAIESRPIVAGNFLRNPVIKYFDYSIYKGVPVADRIDEDGFFTGNHHYDIEPQLTHLRSVLDGLL